MDTTGLYFEASAVLIDGDGAPGVLGDVAGQHRRRYCPGASDRPAAKRFATGRICIAADRGLLYILACATGPTRRQRKQGRINGRVAESMEIGVAASPAACNYRAMQQGQCIERSASRQEFANHRMLAASAKGSTVSVLMRRLNSSCSRSTALAVRADCHWLAGNWKKAHCRSPASSRLSAMA